MQTQNILKPSLKPYKLSHPLEFRSDDGPLITHCHERNWTNFVNQRIIFKSQVMIDGNYLCIFNAD